jgi:hypothetical protein
MGGGHGGRARRRRAVLVLLLAAAVGAGAGFAGMRYADGGRGADTAVTGSTTGSTSGSTTGPTPDPSTSAVRAGGLPEGWQRVEDPLGFSLAVPPGWKRQMDGDQVDYTPDNGRHRIRISVDEDPDFENPYTHMLDVEKSLKKRLPEYQRVKLTQNTFRDRQESCLWEFTWREKRTHPGKRHAIDQVYYTDDGTEYALYMSSPEEDWATTREQFDIVLRHWRPAGG